MSSTLRGKLNEACIQLVDTKHLCTLCDAKLLSESVYDSHKTGKTHLRNCNNVFKLLMESVLSPGITMKVKESLNAEAEDIIIYCILCEQQVSTVFDTRFHKHIESNSHRTKVNQQINMRKEKGLDAFYKKCFGHSAEDDLFLKGVSQSCIIVVNGGYKCAPCNRKLANQSEFSAHMKESSHQDWAFGQLSRIADKIGLSLGVIIKDGSLVCELCNCQFGNCRATADAYYHANEDNQHKKKVQKQIKDGVYDYNKDEMEFPIMNSTDGFLEYLGGDLEEYARHALGWDDRSNSEEMLMYAGLGWMMYNEENRKSSEEEDEDEE